MSERDPIEELSALFLVLADMDFAGYSPLYESLARAIATDRDLLAAIDEAALPNSRRGRVPVLFFAATHDLALAHPESRLAVIFRGESSDDVVSAFRELVDANWPTLVATMRSHSVQTNEVGRSAVLVPAFWRVLSHANSSATPILFEIGPSGGLNLFADLFAIEYTRDQSLVAVVGPSESAVQLHCELRGPHTPELPPTLASPAIRAGIDPNPIDVTSPEECRWLQACLWPGNPERLERLRGALRIAQLAPPLLTQGDAVADLSKSLEALPNGASLIIFSTWALAYINAEGRNRVAEAIDSLGRTRDLAFLTFEEPRFTPWITDYDMNLFDRYHGEGTPTVLGLRSWSEGTCTSKALAIGHPHGRWLHWLEENHG